MTLAPMTVWLRQESPITLYDGDTTIHDDYNKALPPWQSGFPLVLKIITARFHSINLLWRFHYAYLTILLLRPWRFHHSARGSIELNTFFEDDSINLKTIWRRFHLLLLIGGARV